jgi:hypothetical protein
MHTADPNTFLGHVCAQVARMKPNECLTVCGYELRHEVSAFMHNGARFTPADRVLGNIIGSAYTHSYTVDERTGDVTFRRHEEKPGIRYYADPDRRCAGGA